jgi:capsular exopolysaccharide synthesis family protein
MSYPVAENETSDAVPASNAPQFDIKKFIFKLIGFLPWIVISTLVSYSIATLYLRYTAQVHQITAQLLIKDDEESSPDANIVRELGVMPGGKEVQDQIDILQSYELSRMVVDSLHLQYEFIAEGRISSSPLYGKKNPAFVHIVGPDSADYRPASFKLKLYPDNFYIVGPEIKGTYKYGDTLGLEGHKVYFIKNDDVKPNLKGYNLLLKNTRAVANAIKATIYVRKSHDMGGAVEISTIDEVTERAVDIINTLIDAFNKTGLADKKLGAKNTSTFLNDKVTEVEAELDTLEIKSSNFERDNKISDVSGAGNQYLDQLLNIDKERAAQEEQSALLDGLESYVKNAKNTFDIIPSTNGILDVTLNTLILQYNKDVIAYNTQLKLSTEKDPLAPVNRNELNKLKDGILKNIESIRLGYKTKLAGIDKNYDNYSNQLATLPNKERILAKLKRQISVKEQLYIFLLQKKYDSELSIAGVVGDSRIVDGAHDQGVVKPQASQIKMFAIIVGILLPVIVMLLLDFFDNRLADRKEVENGTRTPVLGELSYNKQQKMAIINPQSRNVLAEQFRLIRTNLQYFVNQEKGKLILVTSFMSGEGKSFVSLNLISSLVTGSKRVLLIEMDLRKPKLAKYLNISPSYGLTDYIVSETTPIEMVITNIPGVANADVITSGPIPPNPTELMMSSKIDTLFEYARQNYDYVVVDSSPVGLVADAYLLGNKVDVTLFILRHKYTYKTTIKFVEKLYTDKKLKGLGIIINGIVASSGLGYGYGYGYGYSYGYGYHYGSGYYVADKKAGKGGFFSKLFNK